MRAVCGKEEDSEELWMRGKGFSRSRRTFRKSVVVATNSNLRHQTLVSRQVRSFRLISYGDVVDVYNCTAVAHEYCPHLLFLERPYPRGLQSFRSLNLAKIHPHPRGNCCHHLATSSCNYPTIRSYIVVRIRAGTWYRHTEELTSYYTLSAQSAAHDSSPVRAKSPQQPSASPESAEPVQRRHDRRYGSA